MMTNISKNILFVCLLALLITVQIKYNIDSFTRFYFMYFYYVYKNMVCVLKFVE